MRRASVFFYGLFMDEELLCSKGLHPTDAEQASLDDYALRIGDRASLVPMPGSRVCGVVFSLTLSELDRLYSEPSVQAYRPEAVLVKLAGGGVIAALCYNLPNSPTATEHAPEYAARLRALGRKIGLPNDYLESLL